MIQSRIYFLAKVTQREESQEGSFRFTQSLAKVAFCFDNRSSPRYFHKFCPRRAATSSARNIERALSLKWRRCHGTRVLKLTDQLDKNHLEHVARTSDRFSLRLPLLFFPLVDVLNQGRAVTHGSAHYQQSSWVEDDCRSAATRSEKSPEAVPEH